MSEEDPTAPVATPSSADKIRELWFDARNLSGLSPEGLEETTGITVDRTEEIELGLATPTFEEAYLVVEVGLYYREARRTFQVRNACERLISVREGKIVAHGSLPSVLVDLAVAVHRAVAEVEATGSSYQPKPDESTITHLTSVDHLPQYLTIGEFCRYARVSRNVAYAAVRSKQLPSRVFAGRSIRIPREALLQRSGEDKK